MNLFVDDFQSQDTPLDSIKASKKHLMKLSKQCTFLQVQGTSQLSACVNIIQRLPVCLCFLYLACDQQSMLLKLLIEVFDLLQLHHILRSLIPSASATCVRKAHKTNFLSKAWLNQVFHVQALQDGGYYGALATLPDITSKLVAKQMNHLENILADLRASVYVSDFILHVYFPSIHFTRLTFCLQIRDRLHLW